MIGAWGQGITEQLFHRGSHPEKRLCERAHAEELASIVDLESINNEDLEIKGGQGSFQSRGSSSVLTARREANDKQLVQCLEAQARSIAYLKKQRINAAARKEAAMQAARDSLAPSGGSKGLSLWLLPLLALIPLGYILLRKRG